MSSLGKTDESFHKHALLRQVVQGQYYAAQRRRQCQALLIDLNAGDGNGVSLPQPDLFLGDEYSKTTPEILAAIAAKSLSAHLLLCEEVRKRRGLLAVRFPDAQVIGHNSEAPSWVTPAYGYILVVSDPNGPGHNIEAMQAIATGLARSDFVLTINIQPSKRLLGGPPSWRDHPTRLVRDAYAAQEKARWILSPENWRMFLGKRQAAWTRKAIRASQNYHYHILVVANAMSDVIRRHPEQWNMFP